MAAARLAPSRVTYMPSGPPQRASKAGWTLATTPHRASTAICSALTISRCSTRCRAARTRIDTELLGDPREALGDGRDGGVTDGVEAGLHAGDGAGADVLGDLLDVEVGVPAVPSASA